MTYPEDQRSVAVQDQERSAPRSALHQRRTRLVWLVHTTGWGALLVSGLLLLIWQVALASQGPNDFCQDFIAAQRLLHGEMPYLPLHSWVGYAACPVSLPYDAHPPFSVLFFLPLALLPVAVAALLWGVCSLVSYLAGGLLLLNELGWRSLRPIALFVVGSLCWIPFVFSEQLLNMGQALFLLLVFAWVLERRGHESWAGSLLGLAGLLKIWPAVLLVEALVQRRWRLALTGGLTMAFGTALSLVVLGPDAYAAYLGPVRISETTLVPADANISLVGMVARLFIGIPPLLPPPIPWLNEHIALLLGEGVAVLILIGALGTTWRLRRAASEPAKLLSQGMLLTTLLLIFPVTWYWMLIFLLYPCATTLLALRQMARPPRWWVVLCLVSLTPALGVGWAVLRLTWWLIGLQAIRPQGWVSLLFDVSTIGLLLFTGAQAWLLWRATIPGMTISIESAQKAQGALDVC